MPHFLAPMRLLVLLALLALLGVYILLQLLRKQHTVRYTNLALINKVVPRYSNWRRHIPAAAFLLTLAVVVITAARPAQPILVQRQSATVILAMDVSPSMLSGDVAPDRLTAAKTAAKKFLQTVPPKINVGLVAFSRSGSIRVPPTTDRATMAQGIDDLTTDKYTAIGEGIFASLDAIKLAPKPANPSKKVPAAIVLMSDGESTTGRSTEEASTAANRQKVPVSTIAFGTDHGTVTIAPDPLPQPVDPDPETLQRIADATGGKFYEAKDAGTLNSVYKDLGSAIGYVKRYQESTGTWAFVSVGLLFATAALALVFTNRFP